MQTILCHLVFLPCFPQALYGITRQNPAAMSTVMEGFMAKIESVHPLLAKDAVRKEVVIEKRT